MLAGPKSKFTELEVDSIRSFITAGGHVLVTLGEGGEKKFNTNINFLLEEFGIMINNGKYKDSFYLIACSFKRIEFIDLHKL